jgi:phenylacetate-CoA ligase
MVHERSVSRRLYLTTAGSTGVPVGFYLRRESAAPKNRPSSGDVASGGLFRGRAGSRDSRSRHQFTIEGRIVSYDATRGWLMLSSYHLTPERLPEYLEALEKFKPEFLHAYPSAALQLAGYLEQSGEPWRLPRRGLLCGSERLTIPQKRLLERVFECRAYRWYGHSERAVLAGEGAQSELFYFFPQYGFVEFGPPDEDGLREVIATSFHNLAMPLIRYRTGDCVRLAEPQDASSLEYPWPAAVEIAGRQQEYL